MSTQIQFRRGTNAQHSSFTGANGEITVNTTNKSLHVHDGTTAGGFESAKANLSNVSLSGDATNSNAAVTLATVNSDVGTFGDGGAIPSITVNGKGLITGVTTSSLSNIPNSALTNSTISGVSLGSNLNTLTMGVSGTGLSGSQTYNGSGDVTFTVTSNATSANTASTVVSRDASGDFSAGTITATLSGNVTGNADTASALETSRTIALSGDVSGSTSFDGSANVTITATVADDSHNHVISNVDGLQTALDAKAPLASPALTGTPTAPTAAAGTNTTQVATTAFVSTAVANVIDSAPGALDTLNELAAALGDDANFSTTVTNSIATKLPLSGGEMTGNITFSGSQTVDGRDLSVDGAKLDGIAAGAEVNVQSDWNATSGDAFILNKPTIPTNNNQLTNGAGYITATLTDEQVQDIVGGMLTGNTESGITVTYQDADGTIDFSVSSQTDNNFTTTLKNKLDGIESGATADQTAAEILTAVKTVDGTGSGLDADLLDGQEGSYYRDASNINAGTIGDAYLPATISSNITGNATTATTATNATNIALADESSDTTCFPVFATGATGNQAPKTDSSALTYNASTGTLTATNVNSTSDINKKTNLREVVDSLEILKGIRGVKFNWKENNLPSVGVIAQEVEGVLPELVTETEGVKSVNYNGLVGVLIEAVKELQAEVEELKKTR